MGQPLHIVLSAPSLYSFMKGQAGRLRSMGYSPVVVSGSSGQLRDALSKDGVGYTPIDIRRNISPIADALAFAKLCRLFAQEKPAAVLLSGPKAIFLGGMASWIMGVGRRVAVYHGMRQETLKGGLRVLIDLCDRVSFACATHILAVSPSLRDLMGNRRLVEKSRINVTGNGTANGVDTNFFRRTDAIQAQANHLRSALGIPESSPVIGFVGRITEDKGVSDLYAAFLLLQRTVPGLRLALLGKLEISTAAGFELIASMKSDRNVHFVEHRDDVRPFIQMLDVHLFPSYREGFGLAIAEAASMEIPTVGYDVTGVRDAVVHESTGLLVKPKNIEALAASVGRYLNDKSLRLCHGAAARKRVSELYFPELTWGAYARALGLD